MKILTLGSMLLLPNAVIAGMPLDLGRVSIKVVFLCREKSREAAEGLG